MSTKRYDRNAHTQHSAVKRQMFSLNTLDCFYVLVCSLLPHPTKPTCCGCPRGKKDKNTFESSSCTTFEKTKQNKDNKERKRIKLLYGLRLGYGSE